MVRLQDVARAAGVSTATASRALSRPEMVAPPTRERVVRLATEMGLRLNPSARALTTGRTRTVGVLVPSLANPYFAPVLAGVQQHVAGLGGQVLLAETAGSARDEADVATQLAGHVDGLVLVTPRCRETDLDPLGDVRVVTVDRRFRRRPGVVADTPRGVGDLVEHLAGLGHRDVVLVGGPPGSWLDGRRREQGRRRARELGVELTHVGPLVPTLESGSSLGAAWDPEGTATAVVAYSSYLSLGFLLALWERGIDVPGRVSVAAADDLTHISGPGSLLTSLAVPLHEVGRRAAELLASEGGATETFVSLPTRLVVGRTTGPAPA